MRELVSGLRFPEGPVFLDDGSVLVVEVGGGCITRVKPDGTTQEIARTGGGPNGAAIGPDGALYVCNNGGLSFSQIDGMWWPAVDGVENPSGWIDRVEIATGKVDRLYTACEGIALSAPNDIVFDAAGGFWFTDIGKDLGETRVHGAIYYALPDGSRITRVAHRLITPNGIGLSPDDGTVYFAESRTARLWAIPLAEPGIAAELPHPPLRGHLVNQLNGLKLFDSLAVLANGDIAIATIGGGITTFSPTSDRIEEVPVADPIVTNIAFGGPDMTAAVITASAYGRLFLTQWASPGLRLHYNL